MIAFIREQNTLDEKSRHLELLGDLILQTLETRIRSTVFKDIKLNLIQKLRSRPYLSKMGFNLTQKSLKRPADNYELVAQTLTGFFKPEGGKTMGLWTT